MPPTRPAAALVPEDPEQIGGFRLRRLLGSGGMGRVYEAEELATGRRVALKLLATEYACARDAVERFRQEGRYARMIAHPRCVAVLATDEADGRPYIVMELMPGTTLQDLVKERGPLPVAEAVDKILDVIDGLAAAHQLGVVHRDVKPSNCFLDADGRVKVGDFGLSKSLTGDSHLTRTGAFLGTPLYAAPEQVRAERANEQTDGYAVAATLYFLLAGKAPFQRSDPAATIACLVCDDPPSVRECRPEVPAALDQAILKGLARDRAQRYRNLAEFRQALLPFAPAHPAACRRGSGALAYLKTLLWGRK